MTLFIPSLSIPVPSYQVEHTRYHT